MRTNKEYKELIDSLLKLDNETEWLEFKTNNVGEEEIGEYISALSNSARVLHKEHAYLIFGIDDKTHEIVGTKFNHRGNTKGNEVLAHFLARQLKPSILFKFIDVDYNGKSLIMLEIPQAKRIPTEFNGWRFIRIGSSKVNIKKYPEREAELFEALKESKTILTAESPYQKLTFTKLFMLYASKGLILDNDTFEENLELKLSNGKYNMFALILADENHIPVRVSTFEGTGKESRMKGIKEFGNTNMIYAMDKILEYGDAINIIQSSDDGTIPRIDTPYFDIAVFNESIINAFEHNNWIEGDAPQIHIFSDRLEIISHGGLPASQTKDKFFKGISKPVNKELAEMFLQLKISEKTGRGVPRIIGKYGKEAYEFGDGYIAVTIPFEIIKTDGVVSKVVSKVVSNLNATQQKIIDIMIDQPNVTAKQLVQLTGLSLGGINKNIVDMRKNNIIVRVGSDKSGYWEIVEK